MSLVIVGSLAFDTIETPQVRRERIIGGSCAYSAIAASFFTHPKIVAVVGTDFPNEEIQFFKKRGIDLRGLKTEKGKTFHWAGRYGVDPNQRTTLKLDLNVFEHFKPRLLPDYRDADIVFLGNIDPDLQGDTLAQVRKPQLVAMDTIQHWIENKRDSLVKLLKRTDILFANDVEVRMLSRESNLIKAGRALIDCGPALVAIKKGEHGALILGKDFVFGVLAHPCDEVTDPTGAGDSFAGGFLGYLDKVNSTGPSEIRKAAVYGSVMASFAIEDFGIERLKSLSQKEIQSRYRAFKDLVTF